MDIQDLHTIQTAILCNRSGKVSLQAHWKRNRSFNGRTYFSHTAVLAKCVSNTGLYVFVLVFLEVEKLTHLIRET